MLAAHDGEKAAVDRQPGFGVVVDETEFSELVHEVVDARPRRADHLRQVFLVDPGHDGFGLARLCQSATAAAAIGPAASRWS